MFSLFGVKGVGTVGHMTALRRTRQGEYDERDALQVGRARRVPRLAGATCLTLGTFARLLTGLKPNCWKLSGIPLFPPPLHPNNTQTQASKHRVICGLTFGLYISIYFVIQVKLITSFCCGE
jgi:hypothetical protein